MKIAILHDYFRVIGGAEKLVLILAKNLGADIITSEVDTECIRKTGIEGVNIIPLGKLSQVPNLLPMVCRKRFSECDFTNQYDFFIFSGNFSIYAGKKHSPNIWYCHSPLRGIYDLNDVASKARQISGGLPNQGANSETTYAKLLKIKKKFFKTLIVPPGVGFYIDTFFNELHNIRIRTTDIARDTFIRTKDGLRDGFAGVKNNAKHSFLSHINESFKLIPYIITEKTDKEAVSHMQKIAANSQNVRDRIQKYYSREAVIIHPPVEQDKHKNKLQNNLVDNFIQSEQFWLSVNRVTPEKRVDIQVEAFRNLPGKKLIIVGGHDMNSRQLVSKIFHDCPPNVEYLGAVDHQTLISLYKRCFGLITTALDEDFGMNVVEALSFGKPVIAPNEGGYKETMIHKETGLLVDDIDAEKLSEAVRAVHRNVENGRSYNEACRQRASIFSEQIFIKNIKQEIERDTYRSKNKQLIFIVGVPRSGTTWLWGLLTSHPDIEAIVKSDFPTRPDHSGKQKDSIETNMLFDRDLKEISSVLDKKIKPIIIEKTPDHLLKIGSILTQFHDAKIIHIIRNPLSVFASYKYSDWDRSITDVNEWLVIYKKRIEMFEKFEDNKRIHTVRYEDLHKRPERALRSILKFIGVTSSEIPKMISENRNISKSKGSHGIRRAEINSWKDELNPYEISTIRRELSVYKSIKKYLRTSFWTKIKDSLSVVKSSKKLIFVVGVPRSGTTWVWKLLSEHRDVSILTKDDFTKKNTRLGEKSPRRFKETNMLSLYSIRKINRIVSKMKNEIVIEKTPLHVLKLDTIRREFPNAKIINIVRNPLSVYASYKFTEFDGWQHKGINVKKWVKMYKGMFRKFYSKLQHPHILTISYDSMINDQKGYLKKIYDFIGLPEYNIDDAISKQSFEKSFPRINKERGVDGQKNKLSEAEITYINENLKEEIMFINQYNIYE